MAAKQCPSGKKLKGGKCVSFVDVTHVVEITTKAEELSKGSSKARRLSADWKGHAKKLAKQILKKKK